MNYKCCRILTILLLALLLPCIEASGQSFGQNFDRTIHGELVLRAFQRSFPDKISDVAFIDGDWTITAGEQIFFWAEGRLLPEAERENAESFEHHRFYYYPTRVRPPETLSPECIADIRYRALPQNRRTDRNISHAFHGVLYGGFTRAEVERTLERIVFLGRRVTVHRMIVEPLRRVETEIRRWQGGEAFIASLESVYGYNWRQIAGTQRRSFHSWGLAIDIQPRRLGGRAIFWQWERARNRDWMLIPLASRWNPPAPVIRAFERQGFIWGGKWTFFDNMHFEFRPELFELRRLLTSANTVRRRQ